jgi:hypothetical protein
METKQCSKCKEVKSTSEFYKNKQQKSGLHPCCKKCFLLQCKKYYNKKKEKCKEQKRQYSLKYIRKNKEKVNNYRLIYNYGIDVTGYNQLFFEQNGRCAICKKHQSELNKKLSVDHNHILGKIRGLLCPRCNHALGLLDENIETIKELLNYVQKYS